MLTIASRVMLLSPSQPCASCTRMSNMRPPTLYSVRGNAHASRDKSKLKLKRSDSRSRNRNRNKSNESSWN